MIDQNDHLMLYSVCIPVKGARRSMICDLQNGHNYYVPNDLYDMLRMYNGSKVRDLLAKASSAENREVIQDYINFLIANNLAFTTKRPDSFPPMALEWDEPSLVTNCIIDSNRNSKHDWEIIFDELESVHCRDIQIRFYDEIDINDLESMLRVTENRIFKSIEIFIKQSEKFKQKYLLELADRFQRIKNIYIHSATRDEVVKLEPAEYLEDSMGNVIYLKEAITDSTHCGKIAQAYFSSNVKTFTEALKFNSCLNRKVGIDVAGNIRNCPSSTKSFGKISSRGVLLQIVSQEEFQKSWHIKKDDIRVCQDCEHRYICTDCRAFTVGGEDRGKPAKCSYDPYTGKWS